MTIHYTFEGCWRLEYLPMLIRGIRAIPEVRTLLESGRLEPFSFSLMLYEGLTNAIYHGNRNDLSKKVILTLDCDESALTVRIEDEGEGFDYLTRMPVDFPNSESSCGRGILLMESYEYHIEYQGKGNVLVIRKALKAAPEK